MRDYIMKPLSHFHDNQIRNLSLFSSRAKKIVQKILTSAISPRNCHGMRLRRMHNLKFKTKNFRMKFSSKVLETSLSKMITHKILTIFFETFASVVFLPRKKKILEISFQIFAVLFSM